MFRRQKCLFKSPLRFNTVEHYLLIVRHCFWTPTIQKYSSDFNHLLKRWLKANFISYHSCMEPVSQCPTAFSIKSKFLTVLQRLLWACFCFPPQLQGWSMSPSNSNYSCTDLSISGTGHGLSLLGLLAWYSLPWDTVSALNPFCQTPDHLQFNLYISSFRNLSNVLFRPHPWRCSQSTPGPLCCTT